MNKKQIEEIENTYFDNLVVKSRKKSFLQLIFFSVFLITAIYTLVDLNTNNDTDFISSKSILNNENVQFQLRNNETKFREQINKNLSTFYKDKSLSLIDSISKSKKDIREIKKFLLLSKLKSGKLKEEFYIKIEKMSSPLMEIKGIKTVISIDNNKLENILQSSNTIINEDTIKYGNFLKNEYILDKQLRIDYLILSVFIFILGFVFFYYKNRIGYKDKNQLLDKIKILNAQKREVEEVKDLLEKKDISEKEIINLKKTIDKLESNISNYDFENILKSILYIDVEKAEKKSNELYNRSTLMLVLGLLVAVVGILVFYFTLPEFKAINSSSQYFALTIRPTFVLIFIQSISYYLLRQYRSLISDYKYFYKEFLQKSKIFLAYQLIQNKSMDEMEKKLVDKLLNKDCSEQNINSEPSEKEETSNEDLLNLMKMILGKIK